MFHVWRLAFGVWGLAFGVWRGKRTGQGLMGDTAIRRYGERAKVVRTAFEDEDDGFARGLA